MSKKKNTKPTLSSILPVGLPPSLVSHCEMFEKDQEKAIDRLGKHLQRRGNDPVGYMLLAFMHKEAGDQSKAMGAALMARIFAPGSPFLQRLPYFLLHPDRFEAWNARNRRKSTGRSADQHDFIKDIDQLIDTLSGSEPRKIKINNDDKPADDHVEATNRMAGKIATETLASIYEMQGKTEKAIQTYRMIARRDPSRSGYCEEQISRLSGSQETG
jgi:hypothetical protein